MGGKLVQNTKACGLEGAWAGAAEQGGHYRWGQLPGPARWPKQPGRVEQSWLQAHSVLSHDPSRATRGQGEKEVGMHPLNFSLLPPPPPGRCILSTCPPAWVEVVMVEGVGSQSSFFPWSLPWLSAALDVAAVSHALTLVGPMGQLM